MTAADGASISLGLWLVLAAWAAAPCVAGVGDQYEQPTPVHAQDPCPDEPVTHLVAALPGAQTLHEPPGPS